MLKKEYYLIFAEVEEFSRSSAAAAIIHGGHENGLTAWKDKQGKMLKKKKPIKLIGYKTN